MSQEYYFTSESVSEGHPDKVCDQISDAILDAFLKQDSVSRVACEVLAAPQKVVIAGEYRSKANLSTKDIENIARGVIKDIGYEGELFHYNKVGIEVLMIPQSAEIAQGVDETSDKEEGAGDQGIMFGYACDETPDLMPAALYYSHEILRKINEDKKLGKLPLLGADAKSQVTLLYKNDKPVGAKSVVISHQHKEGVSQKEVKEILKPYVENTLPKGWMCSDEELYVNPTGSFVIGGPEGDSGLTGRKIIVDTYGGSSPHGGGAFSGKDPTKVDRSAAYMMRYLAKNVVAAGLATKCCLQVAYAIGVAKPLALYANTYGTGKIDDAKLAEILSAISDLTPKGIRTTLELNKPIYQKTAAYGHFGRKPQEDGSFSWEKLDLVQKINQSLAGVEEVKELEKV